VALTAVHEKPSSLTVIELLAVKNGCAGLVEPPDIRTVGRVGGEGSFAVHRDDDWDVEAEHSLSKPRGSVSLMPAAHWFRVLNVAGATSTAFAGGRPSVSCGRRDLVRTAWPVTSARLSRLSHDAAVRVGMACRSHPSSWSCRAASRQSCTGGAAHMIQYRIRGAAGSAIMRRPARRSGPAPAGLERQIVGLGEADRRSAVAPAGCSGAPAVPCARHGSGVRPS